MALVSCTWLVPFDTVTGCDGACIDATIAAVDAGAEDAGLDVSVPDATSTEGDGATCDGRADGTPCGTNDACDDTPTCMGGVCTPHPKPDGTPCAAAPDACHSVPVCKAGVCGAPSTFPDGTQWRPGDDDARCCGGKPIETTSNTDCGVCGVACNTSKGQSCGVLDAHYFCLGCQANGDCWSDCCSLTMGAHCSPSDCNTGLCSDPDVCPDMSHCEMDTVNYCSY
jgi:hypothetical protein